MPRSFRATCAAYSLAALASGCAAQELRPPEPGRERLTLVVRQGLSLGGGSGRGFGVVGNEHVEGAKCVARNDKGTWETTTPGAVDVLVEGGKLTVECSHPAYGTARTELLCASRRARSTGYGALAGLRIAAAMGPAAVYAAPVVVAGALVGAMATSAAVGHVAAGPDANVCDYTLDGNVSLWLNRW
jgi:hypothetical protein